MKTCDFCGGTFTPYNSVQRFCNKACQEGYWKANRQKSCRSERKGLIEKPPPRQKPPGRLTDAEQMKINVEVDSKLAWKPDPGRSLKGTPEWYQAVAEVTRIDRIRNQNTAAIAEAYYARR